MPNKVRRRHRGKKHHIGSVLEDVADSYKRVVYRGAVRSILSRALIEFFGGLVLAVVFLKSWRLATMIGGPLGYMFHFVITAGVYGALSYALYPFTGAYLTSANVLFGLVSGSDHKLGRTRTDRIWTSIAFVVSHMLGGLLGAMLASVLPLLPTPIAIIWPSGPFTPVSNFFSEMLIVFVFSLVFGMVTDFNWANEETVCVRQADGKMEMRPYRSINAYFGTALAFARFALTSIFLTNTFGVLNVDVAFWANVWASIWTLNPIPLYSGIFYLLAHVVGAGLAGLAYFLLTNVIRPHMMRKKRTGYQ